MSAAEEKLLKNYVRLKDENEKLKQRVKQLESKRI